MPAPPYSCGTEMPSRPSSAICGNTRVSKRCSRSRSWMRGAISRPAHSRMDCSRRRCSSLRSKLIMVSWGPKQGMLSRALCDLDGRAAVDVELGGGAPTVRRDLEMIGAAEQRADLAGRRVGIGRHDARHRVRADPDVERGVVRQFLKRLAID